MSMSTALETTHPTALDLAREGLCRFLAAALSDPRGPTGPLVLSAGNQAFAREAAMLLRAEAEQQDVVPGFGELPAEQLDLDPFLEQLNRRAEDLAAEYDRAFGLVFASACPPFETEYHANADPFFRAQQMADVAGFYRAFGLTPAATGRPDHLALELEFMAFLMLKGRQADGELAAVCEAALRGFFRDHVAWWVPAFAAGLRRRAGEGLYAALATVLAAWLPAERTLLGVAAPRAPAVALPVEQPDEPPTCTGCATPI
jgi:TorA maturation chaperone TorD